jgi:hypothetical protein
MYPSGAWQGFWVQERWGRQEMTPFSLEFAGSEVTGKGKDVIGRFTFSGQCDERTGKVRLIKQYIGKHRILYLGEPDGEGSIHGEWIFSETHRGPFVMRPSQLRAQGNEPIQEMT